MRKTDWTATRVPERAPSRVVAPSLGLLMASLALLLCALSGAGTALAEDESNCMLCHKNRGLSAIDPGGSFHLFYINQELADASPHRRVKCEGCHADVDRIPHEVAEKVDCTRECHITEPSGQLRFSHRRVADMLARSAHGRLDADGNPKPHQEDYPGCKDCHDQPLYRPFSILHDQEHAGLSPRAVRRCKSCHTSGSFSEDFFEHVTARLRRMRFPMETVEICAKCHADPEFRARHDLADVITSYKETFHGKLLALGSESTADCLDCHVVAGEDVHLIESQAVATSAVSEHNLARTCLSEACHERASPQLAGFQTHVTYEQEKYPLQFWMLIFFKILLAGIMYFFLILVFLELLRRFFPRFAFFKARESTQAVTEATTTREDP